MWQAEIAGQRTAPPQEAPAKGALIRDFQLTSSEGKSILLSEYRGRFNMVLVLAGESEGVVGFLAGLQEHQAELAANEARVLVILAGSQQHASDLKQSLHLNFEVLADKDGHVHRLFGAKDRAGIFVRQYSSPIVSVKYLLRIASRMTSSCPDWTRSYPGLTS